MEQKKTRDIKEEVRTLRKKVKQVEGSRSSIKTKNSEKGEIIKKYRDRQMELEESRNQWKSKYKESQKENAELSEKYAYIASLGSSMICVVKNFFKKNNQLFSFENFQNSQNQMLFS